MSGRTQGEMNDSTPATNAARSRSTFSTMAARAYSPCCRSSSSTGRSGMTSGREPGSGIHSNLTGGTSWNMKSHFQRSDGFDACSQLRRADRPRELDVCDARVRRVAGERFRERQRARSATGRERHRLPGRLRDRQEDVAVVARLARRDRTPSRRPARGPGRSCRCDSFSTHAAPGSTMSAARASSVSSTPWYTSSGSLPDRRAPTTHDTSPSDPSGPGIEHVQRRGPARLRLSARSAEMSGAPALPAPVGRPRSRAPFTFGASTGGTLNFVPAGCFFSLYGPAERNRAGQPLDRGTAPRSTRAPTPGT